MTVGYPGVGDAEGPPISIESDNGCERRELDRDRDGQPEENIG